MKSSNSHWWSFFSSVNHFFHQLITSLFIHLSVKDSSHIFSYLCSLWVEYWAVLILRRERFLFLLFIILLLLLIHLEYSAECCEESHMLQFIWSRTHNFSYFLYVISIRSDFFIFLSTYRMNVLCLYELYLIVYWIDEYLNP